MNDASSSGNLPPATTPRVLIATTGTALLTTAMTAAPVTIATHWWPVPVAIGVAFAALTCLAGWLTLVGGLAIGWNPSADGSASSMVIAGAILNAILGAAAWWLLHRGGPIHLEPAYLLLGCAIVMWLAMAGQATFNAWHDVIRDIARLRLER